MVFAKVKKSTNTETAMLSRQRLNSLEYQIRLPPLTKSDTLGTGMGQGGSGLPMVE